MDRCSFVAVATLVAAAAALLGCGGAWHVVTQAASDPFAGQARFAVLPVDSSHVRVDGKAEQDYLQGRDPKEPTSFADDKTGLEESFTHALREKARAKGITVVRGDGGAEAPFVIQPSVISIDAGTFAPSRSSKVDMDVKIVASDGRVLDEITLSHGTDPDSGPSTGGYGVPANATVGRRLNADGEALGTLVAHYLEGRVGSVHDAGGDPQTPGAEPAPAESSEPASPPTPRPVHDGGSAPQPQAAPPPATPAEPPPPPSPPKAGKSKRIPRAAKQPVAPPLRRPPTEAAAPPPGTPIATSPEFSRLEDGKSRIWVEVSRNVDVAESRSPGRVVYRLRGAAVLQRSDQLPLQTSFFATPVERVQIVPNGSDVDLVVVLREEVVPNYRVVETPRGMVLQVDFPKAQSFGHEQPLPAEEPSRPRALRGTKTQTLGRRHEGSHEGSQDAPPPPPPDDY